ncbi:MAG TPA: hypothetical protein ENI08_00100, partial [Candidatus Dependentiae bacterium]|nr:hypothetical protein [Candidatus Dependentiae bacterium]
MKKVLIVANLYHASPRIPGIAKYLFNYDWEPIILTVPIDENSNGFGAPPKDLKKYCRIVETVQYKTRLDRVESLVEVIRNRYNISNLFWSLIKVIYRLFNKIYRFFYKFYFEIAWYPDEEKNWIPHAINDGCKILENEKINAIITSSSPV